jgi:drug/metabolite transporter (DMT)-like permease
LKAAQPSLDPGKLKPYAALAAGVLASSLSPLFIRWADAPGIMTSFYRMLIAWIILTPFTVISFRKQGRLKLDHFIFPIAAGIFTSFDKIFWSTAIELTTVANATLLNNISPLWVALFAVIIWHERLRSRFWVGLIMVLVGASVVLGSTILIRPNFAVGDYLAIISSFFYAGYYLVTQKGRSLMDTLPYLWVMTFTSLICLLLTTQVMGMPLVGYSQGTYITFFAAAVVSQLGTYFLITYVLGKLPASIVTPTMVAQPVLTALLAIPFAGEALVFAQVVGGGLTLGGIYMVNTSQNRSDHGI